ncbi:hypothetical protein NQ314_005972 [Rhamnusium bicolor]|uniref:UDP-glucuronosyltransferase n=1 Tax=Rhamnusium bicolor TaxID=1586634 RepID=A0AAV8Z9Z6_9CUCU|nr:hypothetical protein NQ314_005972 [Rhamnusium bicolor]
MNIILCVFLIYNIFNTFLTLTNASKILVVCPVAVHSHFILGFRLARELANRGHEVTFINAYPQKKAIKNLREISVEEIRGAMNVKKKQLYDVGQMSYIRILTWLNDYGSGYTEDTLRVKEVQELLKSNEKFDLVVTEHFMNEAMLIFPYKFNCPSVILTPGPTMIFNNHLFANPSPSSYVTNILLNFGNHMSFWDRLKNTYYNVVGELFLNYIMLPSQAKILKRTVPGAPDLKNILYNSSLMLSTSHISLKDPVPLQPAIKEIGGYHLESTKPLPEDLQQFLDNAKEGVILFSMGSNIKSADFPPNHKKAILNIFSKLKQKVLWKFETDLPGKPKNVKIMSWLPQQDILGTYRQNAKMRSMIMHDQPMKQIDEAVFWIQYVIRHKGAPHLKSAGLDLKWYQRYLVDIIFFLAFIMLTFFVVIFYLFKYIFGTKRNVKNTKKD